MKTKKTTGQVAELRKSFNDAHTRHGAALDAVEKAIGDDEAEERVAELEAAAATLDAELERLERNIKRLEEAEEKREQRTLYADDAAGDADDETDPALDAAAARAKPAAERGVRAAMHQRRFVVPRLVVEEPLEYRFDNSHEASFFADLFQAKVDPEGTGASARERLSRHRKQMAELRKAAGVQQRAMSSTAGAGGELVAPLYLNDMFVPVARVGRPIANAIGSLPLPPNTNSLNIPRIATGTTEAAQQDAGAVSSTDATTNYLTIPVVTVAGQVDVSRQLLERATPGLDQILFPDLVGAQNAELDRQVVTGSGAAGQMLGILNTSGIATVTYTDGTPTVPEIYSKLADGIFNRVATLLFRQADMLGMHPRRWGWFAASLDTQNRPLIVPTGAVQSDGGSDGDAFNPVGIIQSLAAQGVAGSILGLPVVIDANVPTNLGAGTNEDRIIIARSQEYLLWEDTSGPYLKVFDQVLSGTLQIRLQAYQYAAFTAGRYGAATAVVAGTGLVTPTF